MKRVQFVINPISGHKSRRRGVVAAIRRLFPGSKRDVRVDWTRGPGDATRIAQQAVSDGCAMIVAVGGDGTVNETARALIGTGCALGVVPGGSGNGFARNLGMPLNTAKAIAVLRNPDIAPLDVGTLNGHPFFNVAGFGLDAEICFAYERFGRRGPLPYFWLAVRAYFRQRTETVIIRRKGREMEFRPMVFAIANLPQYGSGAVIAPLARGNDGRLDICILEPLAVWRALLNAPRLFNRTLHHMKGYRTFQVDSLDIRRETGGAVHVDGNPLADRAQLRVDVLPGALLVARPPGG